MCDLFNFCAKILHMMYRFRPQRKIQSPKEVRIDDRRYGSETFWPTKSEVDNCVGTFTNNITKFIIRKIQISMLSKWQNLRGQDAKVNQQRRVYFITPSTNFAVFITVNQKNVRNDSRWTRKICNYIVLTKIFFSFPKKRTGFTLKVQTNSWKFAKNNNKIMIRAPLIARKRTEWQKKLYLHKERSYGDRVNTVLSPRKMEGGFHDGIQLLLG